MKKALLALAVTFAALQTVTPAYADWDDHGGAHFYRGVGFGYGAPAWYGGYHRGWYGPGGWGRGWGGGWYGHPGWGWGGPGYGWGRWHRYHHWHRGWW